MQVDRDRRSIVVTDALSNRRRLSHAHWSGVIRLIGNGWKSTCLTDQLGCWTTGPLRPQREHWRFAEACRLEACRPHL